MAMYAQYASLVFAAIDSLDNLYVNRFNTPHA